VLPAKFGGHYPTAAPSTGNRSLGGGVAPAYNKTSNLHLETPGAVTNSPRAKGLAGLEFGVEGFLVWWPKSPTVYEFRVYGLLADVSYFVWTKSLLCIDQSLELLYPLTEVDLSNDLHASQVGARLVARSSRGLIVLLFGLRIG
jgi:hypothetical protein